jgi:cytochrome b561
MVVGFRLLYRCAALLSGAAGVLVIASFFIQDRAPRSTEFLGIHLAVGTVFLCLGVLLLGIQRHVAGIAALAYGHDGETAQDLAAHLNRLLAYLLVGGALLCAVLGMMTYGILTRIEQGFAVFG